MRLISFDVGIKNLAYCVFSVSSQQSDKWSIPEWNCVNLLSFDSSDSIAIKPCCQMIKGKRKTDVDHPCNKNSKWIVPVDSDQTYCELHAKMHVKWILPKQQHTTSHINKLKLLELDAEYKTLFSPDVSAKKMKKSELAERIIKHYELNCFRSTVQKTKTAGEIDLVTIGRAIRRQLDGDPSTEGVTHVVIENQISTIASRMKTIQGMIAQYFIMRFGDKVHIKFVSSHNKLKGFQKSREDKSKEDKSKEDKSREEESREEESREEESREDESKNVSKCKTSYKANKTDGIIICRRFFESNLEMRGWLTIFEKSKKKDDLADCFLQGVWYLKSNQIINYADNLKINSVIVS